MPDPLDALILDLLEWIGPDARPYRETMEAWRTSCPRLPVWEEAAARGFIEIELRQGAGAIVAVSARGAEALRAARHATPHPKQ
jgi:D-3-phosphoglycerate dehydrogenase / 2-oxoglutarate reductase